MTMSDVDPREKGPNSARHKAQRKKNWVTLGLLLGFVALVYVISIVKLTTGQ